MLDDLLSQQPLSAGFDEAAGHVAEALRLERFGIITQTDLKETFAKKLGVQFRN